MAGQKTTVNWESAEVWQRVMASLIATGVKVDLKQMAVYFGTTYDTLENRFRKIKKLATELKNEVESGERPDPPKGRSNPTTPRKKTPKKDALSAVTNGRVSKSTPSKKKTIKQEHNLFDEDDREVDAADGVENNGFNYASLEMGAAYPFEFE